MRRALRGAVVGLAWVATLFAVAPLVGGFGASAIAQAVIDRSPGWLSTLAIDLFGGLAQPLLVAGIVVAVVAGAAAIGTVWPRVPGSKDAKSATAVAGGALATGLVLSRLGPLLSPGLVAAFVLALVVPAAVVRLLAPSTGARGSRRSFLRRTGAVVAGGAVALGIARRLAGGVTGPAASERAGEPLERSVSPQEGDPAFDFGDMPAAVTPPDDHYVVDINVENPTVDPESWTLDVGGEVERPYALSYDDLLDHGGSVEQTVTMVCISNEVGGDLIGTAHWTGVPLSELIGEAVPTDEAVDVVTHAADGYSEAIPIELVEREDVVIAYGMGESTLETEHGFPARLLVPGRYGMKCTKWITAIEVSGERHTAYWEGRGWDEEAVINTMSYVRAAERDGSRVAVGGVVFGGLETGVAEIAGVEVRVDGGDWERAEMEGQVAPHAWRRWRHEFEAADRERFTVAVRAIERDGAVQTEEETDPRPSGATGWHEVEVTV